MRRTRQKPIRIGLLLITIAAVLIIAAALTYGGSFLPKWPIRGF